MGKGRAVGSCESTLRAVLTWEAPPVKTDEENKRSGRSVDDEKSILFFTPVYVVLGVLFIRLHFQKNIL